MKKEFIPYEQALALKELGFEEPCLAFYDGDKTEQVYFNALRNASGDYEPFKNKERLKWFGVPLYRQSFRWFREKHNLISSVISIFKDETKTNFEYWYYIFQKEDEETFYNTYEEAELACLVKLIEIVKNKLVGFN